MDNPNTSKKLTTLNRELLIQNREREVRAATLIKANVRKDAPEAEIKKAITTVLGSKRYVSPEMNEKLLNDLNGNASDNANPFDKLSPREFEIVQHLVHGDSLAEMCQKLTLHSSTVGTHKARIYEKLSCNNVIDLSELAKAHNVILA